MVKLTPFGAAGEVTGSAYLVETDRMTIIVDFGMFQGDKEDEARNTVPGRIRRANIDAVIVTHGHLDHTGRLPLLTRQGYRGPIYATAATIDLVRIILSDSAEIQESDFIRRKRRADRENRDVDREDHPIYDLRDVHRTMRLFHTVDYGTPVKVAENVIATFHEAGHMLGSASVELVLHDEGGFRLLFSGDIGPRGLPFLRDPEPPTHIDAVVMESTYGDREHRSLAETEAEFASIIETAVKDKGKVFIPSFAIGRAQNILYYLAELVRRRQIPRVPIYLDSPMAIEASELYARYHDLFDEEATDLVEDGQLGRDLRTLRFCESAEQSKAINRKKGPFIVIAGAGMCNAGRILHHLRNNIEDDNSHIVIVGYQAVGSLGRYLVDGAHRVRVLGEWKQVRAKVHTLGGFSAHAGRKELIQWAHSVSGGSTRFILTHGEDGARRSLQQGLVGSVAGEILLPVFGETMIIKE
jgi:metallo-beta-lactamase family protein